jgi:uncharacterized protein (TIGR02594 family)
MALRRPVLARLFAGFGIKAQALLLSGSCKLGHGSNFLRQYAAPRRRAEKKTRHIWRSLSASLQQLQEYEMSSSFTRDIARGLLVTAVVSAVFVFGLLSDASASTLHPHWTHHSHFHHGKNYAQWRRHVRRAYRAPDDRYSSDAEKEQSRSGFAFTGASSTSSGFGSSSSASPGILAKAEGYIGDGNPTGFRGLWCKAFVNMVLRETGHAVDQSMRAIDGLDLGQRVSDPRPGDIAVMPHHITFFAGWGGRGFYGLGGNQGRRVRMSNYSTRRVIAFIRPS